MSVDGSAYPAPPGSSGQVDLSYDEGLLRRIQRGTPGDASIAMQELIAYCLAVIVPYVRLLERAPDDRDVILQNTCLFVVEHVSQFVFRGKPLKHWFVRVAKNKVREQRRRAERDARLIPESDLRTPLEDPDDAPFDSLRPEERRREHQARRYHSGGRPEVDSLNALPDDLTEQERDRLIHAALTALPPIEHRILLLIYFGEVGNATEIGRLLHMPAGTVRQYHRRALQRLRDVAILQTLFDDLSLY